jgi:hypothetical protein
MGQGRVFNHISDCWQALREATTEKEVDELFKIFPRWSGDWEKEWSSDTGEWCLVVHNWYWDEQSQNEEHDWEELEQFTKEYDCEEEE